MTSIWITLAILLGFTGFALAQKSKKFPTVKVSIKIYAPLDSTFDYIVPVDLSHIFKRYKSLPAIVKTDETEKWITAGLTRTVYFEDNTTAQEKLLTVMPDKSFSYEIDGFTSQLRFLAKRIEGDWLFTDLGNGQLKIDWTYKIIPKNFVARGLIKMVVIKDIKGLLKKALIILKDDLEGEKIKNASR
jgi:hypothetical protein